MEVLALIPARGGSKSIPKKNIVELGGHPLIAFSITSALASKTITRIIVSTDDQEIANTSRRYGAEIPFFRPAELALDDTPDLPVFLHALQWLKDNEGYQPDIVVQLRPTTPFRPKGLIDGAVRLLSEYNEADCIRGMVESGENPFKMWEKGEDGYMIPLIKRAGFDEPYNVPRQYLPRTYWQTGHIDVIPIQTILDKKSLTGKKIAPIFVDRTYCIDIDTHDDLLFAEWVLRSKSLEIDMPGQI